MSKPPFPPNASWVSVFFAMLMPLWLVAGDALAAGPRTLWQLDTSDPVLKSERPGVHALVIDPEVLAAWGPGEVGELALPDGRSYLIRGDRVEIHPNGDRSWIGKFEQGGQEWVAVLTAGAAGLTGEVRTPEGLMIVRTEGSRTVLVDVHAAGWRVPVFTEPDLVMPAGDLAEQIPDSRAPRSALKATPAPQTTIDVLIAYSTGLRTREGTTAAALTRLNQLITSANQAYVDSEVAITLRLVHSVEVAYPDDSLNSDALTDLQNGTGGLAGIFTTLRDRYGADLVVLVRPFTRPSQGSCGIATVGASNGTGDTIHTHPERGNAVVSDGSVSESVPGGTVTYFCPDGTFPHELGHNMGALHDIQTVTQGFTKPPGTTGAYSFSYGYTANATFNPGFGQNDCNAGAGTSCFGTIMSYITDNGILKFSNPQLNNCGTGQACGTAAADVAQTLNKTRNGPTGTQGVASWRAPKVPLAGTLSGTPQTSPILLPFGQPLKVTIRDATNQLVPGVAVNFVAVPVAGASATLSNGGAATTDANGEASVTASANATGGSYTVVATANPSGVSTTFTFNLTNGSVTPTITVTRKGSNAAQGTVSGPGGLIINCGATCSATVVLGTPVTLTASAPAGTTFTGWLGSGCTGIAPCTVTVDAAKTVDATFAPSSTMVPPGAFPSKIDADLNNSFTALTDGLMVLRHLFNLSGNALINNAIGPSPGRSDPAAITTFLNNVLPELDIDGDGRADPLTDGILLIRYMFNIRGANLIQGAVASGAQRSTSGAIEAYIATLIN